MTTVGLDIDDDGKPAAIAVARMERRRDETGKERTHHDVCVLERLSARPYDDAVKRVAEIVDEAKSRGRSKYQPTLYGNVTATGKPVLGALRGNGVRARMIPAYLTEGDRQSEENGEVRLGEGWLVCRLQELVQDGWLHLPGTAEVKELMQELLDWRPGDDQLGSLMIAVGLAVWKGWSGIIVRTVGGPGSPMRFRDPRAERLIREGLNRTS
jgi:hypothetical protein